MEKIKIKQATKMGFIEMEVGGVFDANQPNSKTRRGRVQGAGHICPTITSQQMDVHRITKENEMYRIRKLSSRECFRLMGYTDEDYEKAKYETKVYYLEGEKEKCSAKLKAVYEKPTQENLETYVLCTTNDSQSTEILKTICEQSAKMQDKEKTVNVSIVTDKWEKPEHLECATNIIKCSEIMGMPFTLMEDKDRHLTVITVQVGKGSTNTGKCMKIITESNLSLVNVYTILILLERIIESKIFTATTLKVNIQGCIAITENSEKNFLMRLSNLRMECINERMSNSSLYKQAGNAICENVLVAIFGQMIPGKEDVYKTIARNEDGSRKPYVID